MKSIRYRVYDAKGHFQQSYSNQLADGYSYAYDCARRTGGYIVAINLDNDKEGASEIVCDLRAK